MYIFILTYTQNSEPLKNKAYMEFCRIFVYIWDKKIYTVITIEKQGVIEFCVYMCIYCNNCLLKYTHIYRYISISLFICIYVETIHKYTQKYRNR